MNVITADEYRKAVAQYLRNGRVRLAHRMNDGRIFSRANPLETQVMITIADAARSGKLPYDFSFNYDFSAVAFSHGNSTVSGEFNGAISRSQQMLNIEGVANFKFKDIFTDPVDMRSMSAWIREQPDRIRRLLQRFGEIYGIGDSPQGDEIEIDEDAVSAVFFAISELGGIAYRITGEWEANFKAAVLIDRDKSQYIGNDEEFNQ